MVRKAVIGLGGNLGDVERQLRLALEALDGLCGTRLLRVSPFYRTAAVEVAAPQPDYLNCVAEIETSLSPHALLGACLGIESALGRLRVFNSATFAATSALTSAAICFPSIITALIL